MPIPLTLDRRYQHDYLRLRGNPSVHVAGGALMITYIKPDIRLIQAIRAAILRHKLNNQLSRAVRAARSVA